MPRSMMIAEPVAAGTSRRYVDVRALLPDPVDLRSIPWRGGIDQGRDGRPRRGAGGYQ